jgi:hypothetical protein
LLDERGLTQLRAAQRFVQFGGQRVDAAFTAGFA